MLCTCNIKIKIKGLEQWQSFSISRNCDLDLDSISLKGSLVCGIAIPNIAVMVYQNWLINEVTGGMTKGEHM